MTPGQSNQNVLGESMESPVSVNFSEDSEKEKEALLRYRKPESSTRCYIPARYVLALWSFLGFVNMFTLRMDLNIALLAMVDNVNSTAVGNGQVTTAATVSNSTHLANIFNWSERQQDILLGSFFYGYCSTQILGGHLSGRTGPKVILGFGIMVTSVLSLLMPLAAERSYYLILTCRILQGMAQGLAQPCMHTMWSKWAPESEKSWLMTITYSGCQVGTVIATWATGCIVDTDILGGWPLVFYVFGGCGVLWSVAWLLLVHDTPAQHPRINQSERDYIQTNVLAPGIDASAKPVWCKVLRSPALLAIVAAHFANDWGFFALTVCLPSYMHRVLQFHIRQNGFLSSLPFIVLVVTNPLSGYLADKLRGKGILSTKNTRKLVNSIGLFIPAALMFGVCYVGSDRDLIVALLTMAVGFSGFTMAGYSVNHLDIAPTFAGVLYGLTNTIGTTTGFIGPAILAALTGGVNNKNEWIIFFYLTSGIFFFGGLVFLLFAQGEPQDWSVSPDDLRTHPTTNSDSLDVEPSTGYQHGGVVGDADVKSNYFQVAPSGVHSTNSIQHSPEITEDLKKTDSEWEELLTHRRHRRTAHVSSFSVYMYSW